MYREIKQCRICGNGNLRKIVDLGVQSLTGVFPKPGEIVGKGPLRLVKCVAEEGESIQVCGLVQLQHSWSGEEMYGNNYGYRSGLNASMVKHLRSITDEIKSRIKIKENDLIIDIGSNDSTLLQTYNIPNGDYVGMDPTGVKFSKYYPDYIELVPDFFSAQNVKRIRGEKKAKVVTSIAMFYDLEAPIDFAKDVCAVLADDGIWVMEQSYLPAMLEANSYDTICQEHLEFYCLKQIEWIVNAAGLHVIDVSLNEANGGSFRVTVAKGECFIENESVKLLRTYEEMHNFDGITAFETFKKNMESTRQQLKDFLKQMKYEGKKVYGYGASTKGNVLLQYCNITSDDVIAIAEVNEDKFGHVTPGTNIPIMSEQEVRKAKPDYLLVLPWHFRNNILAKEEMYRKESGCRFVFPLPQFEIV